jgi:hypothetical protein
MNSIVRGGSWLVVALCTSCGTGASSPPSTPATTSASAPAAPVPSAAVATPPPQADEDPNESATPITMTVELTKETPKSSFPKRTVDDLACWQTVSLGGDAQKDYEAVTKNCGAPTGLLEYAKPVVGHLRAGSDKTDTFRLALTKGLCYRYIAVADSGIRDLDILVERPGGDLVADDKQHGPVAIIEADKTWCMTTDADYEFHIEVDGEGAGRYVFGVWARPKS